jgi:hypothetical protein
MAALAGFTTTGLNSREAPSILVLALILVGEPDSASPGHALVRRFRNSNHMLPSTQSAACQFHGNDGAGGMQLNDDLVGAQRAPARFCHLDCRNSAIRAGKPEGWTDHVSGVTNLNQDQVHTS